MRRGRGNSLGRTSDRYPTRRAARNATCELWRNVRENANGNGEGEEQIGSSDMSAARTRAGTRRRNNCLGSCYSAHDPVDKRIRRRTEVTACGRSDKGLCKLTLLGAAD